MWYKLHLVSKSGKLGMKIDHFVLQFQGLVIIANKLYLDYFETYT